MSLLYNTANEALYTRQQLHSLPLPPARGRFHQPVPFGDYTDLVADSLERNGLRIVNEEYAVAKDHDRMFGLLDVEPLEGELILAKDWKLQVGVRGSHDQSIPRGLTLGSQVLVCSNLCFHGGIGTFQTKQTTNIWNRLPMMVREAVARIPQLAMQQEHKFDAYKNATFKPRWGDAALVEIHRRGGLTPAQLGRAISEWDHPSYDEHAELGYTAWRLLNAATEALKPTGERVNHELIRQRSEVVSSFLDDVVGVERMVA